MYKRIIPIISFLALNITVFAQDSYNSNKFHQLEEILPTANETRTGSGAPGPGYWQQKVDYTIKVSLDDEKQTITGSEVITYTNNSPDVLTYLWLQLDQNIFAKNSDSYTTETKDKFENMSFETMEFMNRNNFDGGFKLNKVTDASGKALKYTVNKTMMRLELPTALLPKGKFVFSIDWFNNINNAKFNGGRGGMEYFEKDGNWIYEEAQWFPRLCVYDDVDGWQNKQYLGNGEFALEFGDYHLEISVPNDMVVASTGVLKNGDKVLKKEWQDRLNKARNSDKPVIIVTQDEATANEKNHSKTNQTWIFDAENVRDVAWAASRKFIWDAANVKIGSRNILAMSYYPKEGNPLWEKYSTQAIIQTLITYSKHTVDYPYPVAISVNGPIGGMEYPMICFNGPRPEADGTYSEGVKLGLIGVVIHEVGHNFFPMIINSDERQWTWMDEGLNTFCQYLTEQQWEEGYPSRRGEAKSIIPYMSSDKKVLDPIMTNSESILQFGNNAYGKPAAALNILRETVMGRELFDYAFKEYARRWAFKHPMPADFFRTMEDASAVDLDWYFRGWFYGTDACDISIKNVSHYVLDGQDPEVEKTAKKAKRDATPISISEQKNKTDIPEYRIQKYPEIGDFYSTYDPLVITENDRKKYQTYYSGLSDKEKEMLKKGMNYYMIEFENIGGLVMPVIVEMEYTDGSKETVRIPAEIWRKNNETVTKMFTTNKVVKQFTIDPLLETADIDSKNNHFPRKMMESEFQLFKQQQQTKTPNPMQLNRDGKL